MFSQATLNAGTMLRLAALQRQQRTSAQLTMSLPMIQFVVLHTMGVHAHQPRA